MSTSVFDACREKPVSRWSVVRSLALSPAPNAGLPVRSACVCVGPPLSARGSNSGSAVRVGELKVIVVAFFITKSSALTIVKANRLDPVSYLFDNILWGNTNYGGDFTAPGNAKLVENDYGSLKITPSMNARFQTVDPRFVDPDNGDFHLAGDSPVIGQAFSASTFDLDLEGHDNAFPGPADFGAYQTTIFSSGFDVLPSSLK